METIVEILELVGLVLVAVWIYHHVIQGRRPSSSGCGCGGHSASGVDLSFPQPNGGCS